MNIPKRFHLGSSVKHLQIDKANARIVGIIAGASALLVFSLIASRSLLSQIVYQNRVLQEKDKALVQLKKNNESVDSLVSAFRSFDEAAQSVIGTSDKNSRIILDALPSKYDFPALASSLEKILTDGGYKIGSIGGSDEELTAQQSSSNPTPIEIPFQLSASGSYSALQKLISDLGLSIRPISIGSIDFAGSSADMRISINAKTYYQPEKNLDIQLREVK